MRSLAFLAAGLALLLIQSNVFRALDGLHVGTAAAAWTLAVIVDVWATARQLRGVGGRPRAIASFRADLSLPMSVLLSYSLLGSFGHASAGRPIPPLVLPLLFFMGLHEYSLARGALVAFLLGYATDVLGIAPVGLHSFTFVATFALARAAGVRLAAQTIWMQVLLAGAFAALQSTMVLVFIAIFGRDAWVPRALYPLALPHAIATAAVAPIVFRLAQYIHVTTAGAPPAEARGGGATS